MKRGLALLLVSSFPLQSLARCNEFYANAYIDKIFGLEVGSTTKNEASMKKIGGSSFGKEVSSICGSRINTEIGNSSTAMCYDARSPREVYVCKQRYISAVKSNLDMISEAVGKKPDLKILETMENEPVPPLKILSEVKALPPECAVEIDQSFKKDPQNNFIVSYKKGDDPTPHKLIDDDGGVVAAIILQSYLQKTNPHTASDRKAEAVISRDDKKSLAEALAHLDKYYKATFLSDVENPELLKARQEFSEKTAQVAKKFAGPSITVGDMADVMKVVEDYRIGRPEIGKSDKGWSASYSVDGESTSIYNAYNLNNPKLRDIISKNGSPFCDIDLSTGGIRNTGEKCEYHSFNLKSAAGASSKEGASKAKAGNQ